MRIFVVEASAVGGLIHYSYHLCRALQRKGADTTLVTATSYELDNLDHEFAVAKVLRLWDPRGKKAVNPIWAKVRRGLRGVQYIAEWLRLIMYLRREKPDVILFGEIRFGFEYYFLKMLKSSGLLLADIVHDVRSYDTSSNTDTIVNESQDAIKQYDRIYGLFDALFVHDRSNVDLFLDLYTVPENRVHEIVHCSSEIMLEIPQTYTPQQLRELYNVKVNQKTVVFFGTITKYKGVDNLIRAWKKIYEATGARLIIAGFPAKDVDPNELKALAAQSGHDDEITWFLDYVPNEQVKTLMDISNVTVYPYRAITQSGVIQIAYACATPVVATRVGGLVDVIEDGKSGFLVEEESPDAIADAVIKVLSDSELEESMSKRAKELADTRYAWTSVAEKIIKIFETL